MTSSHSRITYRWSGSLCVCEKGDVTKLLEVMFDNSYGVRCGRDPTDFWPQRCLLHIVQTLALTLGSCPEVRPGASNKLQWALNWTVSIIRMHITICWSRVRDRTVNSPLWFIRNSSWAKMLSTISSHKSRFYFIFFIYCTFYYYPFPKN